MRKPAHASKWSLITRLSFGLLLVAASAVSAESLSFAEGKAQYQAENFDEALPLLERAYQQRQDPQAGRFLGLTYYHLLRYREALPLLRTAVASDPADIEARFALTAVLLGLGDTRSAAREVQELRAWAPNDAHTYELAARVHLALDEDEAAVAAFERALALDPTAGTRVGVELARGYASRGKVQQAQEIAQTATEAFPPPSFAADSLRSLLPALQAARHKLEARVDYRVGYDSNVVLEPDNAPAVPTADGKSAGVNIFTGDLLGRYNLWHGLDLFGEAHLYQSLYFDLNEFDQTRQNYLLGLGWSASPFGLRLPYEFTHVDVDFSDYLTAHTVTPGAYVNIGPATLHGFFRYQDNDYDEDTASPSENRSGDELGFGALLLWPFQENRGLLRVLAQGVKVDADGRNWKRDEIHLLSQLTYQLIDGLAATVAFEWRDDDYDEVNDVFLVKRDDDAYSLFAGLSYRFAKRWEVTLQGLYVKWDSNIPVYEYDRTVVALGISWQH